MILASMNRFFRYLVFSVIVLSHSAYSQSPDSDGVNDQTAKPKGRLLWIMATSLPVGVSSPVKVLAGEDLTEVKIMKRAMGLPVKVPKDGIIHLVSPEMIINDKGESAYERYASIQIPEGVRNSLVILIPDAKLPAPLKFRSRVIDLDKFKGGDSLFMNLTNLEIGVALGKLKKPISPGKIEVLDVGKFDGTKVVTVSYHYRNSAKKPWNLISASSVALVSSRREILIFHYDENLGQVDYFGMSFDAPND